MSKAIRVLLVEDNPADADLICEALEGSKLRVEFTVAMDGVRALAMLNRRGEFADMPRPDLILLDLNLPKKDGRQVLAEIKANPELRGIPVVILSSSDAEKDIAESYALGANGYLIKAVDLRAFQSIVQAVEGFWSTMVKLPCGADPVAGAA
jgi:CheY-like chemotaxis protein